MINEIYFSTKSSNLDMHTLLAHLDLDAEIPLEIFSLNLDFMRR